MASRTDVPTAWSESATGVAVEPRESCLVGVFPGEGIGAEVIASALLVGEALEARGGIRLEVRHGGAIGREAEAAHGEALTPDAEEFCRGIFAEGGTILHGPGGGRFVYELRRRFDLFCKISPVQVFPALRDVSCFQAGHLDGVDFLVVRDNSGGVYQGRSRETGCPRGGRAVEHVFSYTEAQVVRIVRVAARLAARREGRLVVVVKDGGVQGLSDLWRGCASAVAADAGVAQRILNVDHAAYEIIRHPRDFDVLVAPNMFGDILVDLSALLSGSRGLGYSGNYSAGGAVYQTNHGAAYELAGRDVANPVGQILSLAMLLRESFGRHDAAGRIFRAVGEVWGRGWRTADLAEPGCRVVGTRRMGELVAEAVAAA